MGKFESPNREICSKIAVGLDSEKRQKEAFYYSIEIKYV